MLYDNYDLYNVISDLIYRVYDINIMLNINIFLVALLFNNNLILIFKFIY